MTVIHGFELVKEQEIPEINSRGRLFRHVRTGAELLSLENDDENKVFGVTLRTPPPDSTGLPHIMEHSLLCGSRKYPLNKPFVELIKGSLKTFLNAFTFPDKTCYPVASQNLQDFYNLVDVYVDAVFYPLISPEILQQEGWHYELEDVDAPLRYKGVVYNEMKGAYSSPDNLLGRTIQHSLFPDTTYGFDSGGDPSVIPALTYAQFRNFHAAYYHPSNARIYFYGDDDPVERLRRMDGYLEGFGAIRVDSEISLQSRFDRPTSLALPYDAGQEAGKKKSMLAVNWLLAETTGPELSLGLRILASILIGTPASPLRKALIESGLGEDLAGVGLETDLRQSFFSTGLKGIASEDAAKAEELIFATLQKLAGEGIDADTVAAAVNTVEFRLRENNTGSFPRGLSLMLRSLTTWLYGDDPFAPLAFEAPLSSIKERLAAGERYFENLIVQFLLENPHRTSVLMQPDPELRQRREAAEKERMASLKASFSQAELQAIVENTRLLKLRQETPDSPEALRAIPTLKLSDLDKQVKTVPLEVQEQAGSRVLLHDLFTNGILYLDAGFDLHALPAAYLPYVPLFGRALLEMGTEREDFVRLSQRIGRSTGGIRPALFTSAVQGSEQGAAWLFLRGKATLDQAEELLAILRDILLSTRLDDRERFRQMALAEKASQEAGLAPGGHAVVNLRLRSLFNEADWAAEQMGGVSYLFFLRQLIEMVEKDWPAVVEKLEELRRILLNRDGMLFNLTLDGDSWGRFQPHLSAFLKSLPARPLSNASFRGPRSLRAAWEADHRSGSEGLTIPAQVNYVGKGANLFDLGYEMNGSIAVITNTLRNSFLWERVRMQGGAYGALIVFDHHSGVLTFLSYRDPNLLGTLQAYDHTAQYLQQAEIDRDELVKSIIGAIGAMDAYQLPDARGYTSMLRFLTGDSDEKRQRRRDQILATTQSDYRRFAGILQRLNEAGRVVVLGSPEAIQAAAAERPGWLEVTKVL